MTTSFRLYPNAHLKEVGYEVAEMDVATCKTWAQRQVGNKSTGGTIAKNTVIRSSRLNALAESVRLSLPMLT